MQWEHRTTRTKVKRAKKKSNSVCVGSDLCSGQSMVLFSGAERKDGVSATAHPRPGAIQDRHEAHRSVQGGDPQPVRRADGHPGGDGSLRLRRAAAEGAEPGEPPPQLHE